MMVAMTMTVALVGVTSLMYGFVAVRMGHALSKYTSQREAERAEDLIAQTVSLAQGCSLQSLAGNPALKCTMPANCSDLNADQVPDVCGPISEDRRGLDHYGTGQRIWFYVSDVTATPTVTGGSILYMASRLDDSNPTVADAIQSFTYYPGGTLLKLHLLTGMSLPATGQTRSYTSSISTASTTQNDTTATSGTDNSQLEAATISRTAYTRDWRS